MYEDITYESLLEEKLDMVPPTFDTRQGSVMYNTLAPNAAETAVMYLNLSLSENRFFADTAKGEDLDRRCEERGVYRKRASPAVRLGIFKNDKNEFMDIEVGKRFRADENIFYVSEKRTAGNYEIICETSGSTGNDYLGALIPVDNIPHLTLAQISDILIPGENEEDDESLRKKYYDSLDTQAFGGNVADYKSKTKNISGVGGVKVTPVWNGGGTVKLTIIDSSFLAPSSALIATVQELIDPIPNQGKGLGIAPIGHIVTVSGVLEEDIRLEFNFTFQTGMTYNQLMPDIQAGIKKYFAELASTWEDSNSIIIRISQLETRMLNINGIEDVQDTKINNLAQNLELDKEHIPKLGTVVSV